MNYKYILLSLISLFIGIILFAFQQELLIIRVPKFNFFQEKEIGLQKKTKKNIKLFYWKNSKWNFEDAEILWSNNNSDNIQGIVSNWLLLLDENRIIEKKVSLQNSLSSSDDQTIYLSFDRNLFNENNSTYEKLMLIEGLLKTIRESDIKIQKIQFLVHHQEMIDQHLDFSHPWTLQGFIAQ